MLFNRDDDTGAPVIRKPLEHGLGHLLPPAGETNESWITKFWYIVLCKYENRACDLPAWFDQTALAQLTISSPHLLKSFRENDCVQPSNAIAPFNFMVVGYSDAPREGMCKKHGVASIGCRDASPCRYRAECPLVQPVRPVTKYTKNHRSVLQLPWWDAHTGAPITVETVGLASGILGRVPLKTFGDVFGEFIIHPESKAADIEGRRASEATVGELYCLRIEAVGRSHIGKEARDLEVAQAFGNADGAALYYDAGWPALRDELMHYKRAEIAQISGLSRGQVYSLLSKLKPPPPRTQRLLAATFTALKHLPHAAPIAVQENSLPRALPKCAIELSEREIS